MTSTQVRRLQSRVARTSARFVAHATRNGISVSDLPAAKLPWYEVRSAAGDGPEADTATILLFDEIGGSFGVDAKSFVEELDAVTASTIKLRINSPGGSVFEALAIQNALRHHPARVVGYVDGLAASAASVVAMAADELVMMPGSQLMIHDASAVGDGNADEMDKLVTFLDRQSDNIADLYRMKGGGDAAEWRALMRAETWMFAQEAVGFGLADRVEQVREKTPDSDTDELLTRSFDLGQFRYAGRAAAPTPQRLTRAGFVTPRRSRSRATAATSPDVALDRVGAAQARAAAMSGHGRPSVQSRSEMPRELGAARMVPARAQMRSQLQDKDDRKLYRFDGIASVTDTPYAMYDHFGEFEEVVSRAAFAEALAESPDVAFLLNHRGMTMARTVNGTLDLSLTDEGLRAQAWLNPERQDVKDLVIAIDDGDITEMSFAFELQDGQWSDDFRQFTITKLSLNRGDVSAVNYGANPYTSIGARSREILSDLDHLPAGAARAAFSRLSAREDVQAASDAAPELAAADLPAGDVVARAEFDAVVSELRALRENVSAAPAATAKPAPLGASVAFYEALHALS